MSKELSLDVVRSQLSPKNRLSVNQEVIDEINKLSKNPEYGEEFLETYMMNMKVLKDHVRANHTQYINAIKFYTLVESHNSLIDAYIKVFPERYDDRKASMPDESDPKSYMTGEASRYNASNLVNEIRKLAGIPVNLIHRNLLHEAILETANLMRNASSHTVRQKAAATLIQELKPQEGSQIQVNIGDGSTSVIEELRKAAEKLATAEYEAVVSGSRTLKDIAGTVIITQEED